MKNIASKKSLNTVSEVRKAGLITNATNVLTGI